MRIHVNKRILRIHETLGEDSLWERIHETLGEDL